MSSVERTLRGRLNSTQSGAKITLMVDDGRLTHGHRITNIQLWPARASQVGNISAVLATNEPSCNTPMDSGNNGQIAWVYAPFTTSEGVGLTTIIDPNHIVVQELLLLVDFSPNFIDGVNYLISICPVQLTEAESAFVQIKARQQNVSN
jgi:hypothetical protein